jgi:hypothetical protein
VRRDDKIFWIGCQLLSPNFNPLSTSSWMRFSFFTVVLQYLNFVIRVLRKDYSAIFILWFCPAFWCRGMQHREIFRAITINMNTKCSTATTEQQDYGECGRRTKAKSALSTKQIRVIWVVVDHDSVKRKVFCNIWIKLRTQKHVRLIKIWMYKESNV